MKTNLVLLLSLLIAGTLSAEPQAQPKKDTNAVANAEATVVRPRDTVLVPKTIKANQIDGHKVAYSGIVVQVVKTKAPLQLINPMAPAEYGSGEQNLDRDMFTGRPAGFKFFSISF